MPGGVGRLLDVGGRRVRLGVGVAVHDAVDLEPAAVGVAIGVLFAGTLALVRRFLSNLVPQHFALKNGSGVVLADYKTHFNPFVHRMTVQVSDNCPLNPAVPLAAGMLLMAVEGRQEE